MKFLKNIDVKILLIIFLIGGLIFAFFFDKNEVDRHKEEIQALHKENEALINKNDTLKDDIKKLDLVLLEIDKKIETNNKEMDIVMSSITSLKKKQNEIHDYVNGLSANRTADAISDYLERTESKGNK